MIILGWILIGLLCLGYLFLGFALAAMMTFGGSPNNWLLRVLLRLYFIFLWPTYIFAPILGLIGFIFS